MTTHARERSFQRLSTRRLSTPVHWAGATVALTVLAFVATALPNPAEARPVRNTTRTSVNRNVNVNRNMNVHRDIDVDVDHHYGYGGRYYPVGRAVAATAVTAIAIGTVVHSLPPSCSTVVTSGITYQNCSGTWYQPRYSGTQVTYVVVNQP
ncbi:MAG TPA: DUF6515 family protein [Polyangiaceae bacterium]